MMETKLSKRKRACCSSSEKDLIENSGEFDIPTAAGVCFAKLLHHEEFCDVSFLVGPSKEQFKAHRLFLIARSSMFRAHFRGRWDAGETIELPQFAPATFKSFLKFVYTDQLDLENTDWISVLGVANYFLVQPLVNICADIALREAGSDISKAVEAFQTARLYEQGKLMDELSELMAKSFTELAETDKFKKEIDDETLVHLLQLDHLRVNESRLFTIILSLAKARARNSGGEEHATVTVSSEVNKFLPLIRIPTMSFSEFRSVVDTSGMLTSDTLLNLYRYFAARDDMSPSFTPATGVFSQVPRRCREYVQFYGPNSSSAPEARREIPVDGLQLQDSISFSAEETRLNPVEINPLKLCKFTKLDDIVAIGIQCPTVCLGSTEVLENLICSVEVQTDYKYLTDQPAKRNTNQFTCTVKSGQFAEVSINLPAELRYTPNSSVHIMVKMAVDPSHEKISKQKCLLLGRPSVLLSSTAKAKLCDKSIQLEVLQSRQGNQQDNWQLIRGVRIQKGRNANALAFSPKYGFSH